MKDNEKGYVTPTPVSDAEKLTKEVNNSIDENKIKETNNKIKTKQMPLLVKFISIVATIMIIFFASFYAVKYSKKFIEGGEVKEEEKTTVSPQVKAEDYFNKNAVRKYESDDTVVLFLPKELYNIVFFLKHNDKEVTDVTTAIYEDNMVQMSMDEYLDYSIVPGGIKIGDNEYKISSGEMKYYVKEDENASSIMVMNGQQNALYGIGLVSGVVYQGKYMEDDNKITLTEGSIIYEFKKKSNDVIVYNDLELVLK